MRLPDVAWNSGVTFVGASSAISPVSPGATQGAFSSLYREVDAEVRRFIAHGQSDGGGRAPGMTPEGAWQRLRLKPPSPPVSEKKAPAVDGTQRQTFLSSIAAWADEAAERLGVSSKLIAAHAALESGWGQRPIRQPDGSDSHNLFGIKASPHWHGEVVEASSTEYEDGHAHKRTERFRSYPDMTSAFEDYARLLLGSPRYRGALNVGDDAAAFARGLARGGYATDPDYARKLVQLVRQIQ